LEELGITPDHRHHMTRRDLLKGNGDLIRRAAQILKVKPVYSLSVKLSPWRSGRRDLVLHAGSRVQGRNRTQNIARLDIYVGDRPYKTFDASHGAIKVKRLSLRHHPGKNNLLVQVFDGANNLVATYRHK
jgi:hypothetical protein